jgi:hypothetical protein
VSVDIGGSFVSKIFTLRFDTVLFGGSRHRDNQAVETLNTQGWRAILVRPVYP